ncbi:DUF1753-domain-containing protein [Wallemia mellicola]|nr:DUF1753-domain-containing protein [Wallemia mellicola]TIB87596.1 DUF1753-domain-containing protein [Wallemia mellicola]TIC35755.1 DUF1753-domain-containing protein [Wallemia mellicola]TIC40072.1 DUF1753-domain-containing protein [Wallemia mellicola]TIC48453.1 DUF1753-domain-containing protein [Wallemia mellicola]
MISGLGKLADKSPLNKPIFRSLCGLDIKLVDALTADLGCTIITAFALFNKVAGVYGVNVIFTGGTFAQLSMYLYSVGTLAVFVWGLKQISEENPSNSLAYANLFAIDHIISTIYSLIFFKHWYIDEPHDGRRADVGDLTKGWGGVAHQDLTELERVAAAEEVWGREKVFAALVLLSGFIAKLYFILIIYSFSLSLIQGTYYNSNQQTNRANYRNVQNE